MKLTFRPRIKSGTRVEMFTNENKLVRTVDEREIKDLAAIPQDERLIFDFTANQLVTCKKLFKMDYQEMIKVPMHLPMEFYDLLNKLSLRAHESGIPFNPNEHMLRALYREAERVQDKISRKNGKQEGEGVKKYQELFIIEPKSNSGGLSPAIRIMKELLGVESDFYTQFNEIAEKHYGKENRTLKKHMKGYAAGHSEPSNWIVAIALEVLAKNKINVYDLGINKDVIDNIWLRANQNKSERLPQALGC